jgi:hypothetical protein
VSITDIVLDLTARDFDIAEKTAMLHQIGAAPCPGFTLVHFWAHVSTFCRVRCVDSLTFSDKNGSG